MTSKRPTGACSSSCILFSSAMVRLSRRPAGNRPRACGGGTVTGKPGAVNAGSTEAVPERDLRLVVVLAARAAVDDLTAQAGAAFVYVQVTGGMSRDTRRQAANDASRVDADVRVDTFNLSMLSQVARVHVTDPRTVSESPGKFLDLAGWDRFTRAIGEQQYRSILDAVEYVSAAGVEPDFSPPSSPSPAGRTSSES